MNFTLEEYRGLVSETIKTFQACSFEDALSIDPKSENAKRVILRHDIDFSPSSALSMAEIESEIGIKSNYTVMLGSNAYNPFESKTRSFLREIVRLGHKIGLHFDASLENIVSEQELDDKVSKQAEILEYLLETDVGFFSYHNTNEFVLSCNKDRYGGRVNCYARAIFDVFSYTSDSHGIWLYDSWQNHLYQQNNFLQVLTHPVWWTKESSSSPKKISNHYLNSSLTSWKEYCLFTMKTSKDTPQKKFLPFYEMLGEEGLEMLWLHLNGYTIQAEHLFKSLCIVNSKAKYSHKNLQELYNEMSSL